MSRGKEGEEEDEVDDLCSLDELNQTVILNCLKKRYENDKFYTYIGDVLVAFNPCQPLSIYSNKFHKQYSKTISRHLQPPHIYWTADHAYQRLVESREPRCVIVSGDSGAGKTESTKHVLNHLVRQGKCIIPNLVDKLERVSPLLELFGNAVTTLNPNSSRFGKLIELHYDENGTLVGAEVQCYTLEKSRVVHHAEKEKNFHVFYSLFAGLTEDKREELGINDEISSFRILMPEETADLGETAFVDVDEKKEYEQKFMEMRQALEDINFSRQQIDDIHRILAAILLLCNVTFIEDEALNCPTIEDQVEEDYLRPACKLLGIDPKPLVEALLCNVSYTNKGEEIRAAKTLPKARDGRDALAKHLYCRLFDCIVRQINYSLKPSAKHGTLPGKKVHLGILDISGFENLGSQNTGFEQLLINITNETLHKFFLRHMFDLEREAYRLEGVVFTDVIFSDNQDALDLLLKAPFGVLPLLEETVAMPKSTDSQFVKKLEKHCSQHQRFKCQNSSITPKFNIVHYAGEVVYCATGFLDKNTDTLSTTLKNCIKTSTNPLLQSLTGTGMQSLSKATARSLNGARRNDHPATQGNRLQEYVTKDFVKSLQRLNTKLTGMKPLFVRCVKPNGTLTPGKFDTDRVQAQLKSSGVLEVAKVRKEGYPARFLFDEFLKRFLELVEDIGPNLSNVEKVKHVLNSAGIKGHQMGVRKVFLKYSQVEMLDNMIDRKRKEKERRERELQEEEERKRKAALKARLEAERQQSRKSFEKSSNPSSSSSSPSSSPTMTRRSSASDARYDSKSDTISDAGNDFKSDAADRKKDKKQNSLPSVKEEEEDEETAFGNRLAYDMFRETERDTESSNVCEERCLKALRLFVILLLFSCVLVAAVVAKLSLLTLIANFSRGGQLREEHASRIILCAIVPLGITFILSFIKIMFGKRGHITKRLLAMLIVIECSQTFGTVLLLFRVFPHLDTFRCLALMVCPGSVPALLNVFEKLMNPRGKFLRRILQLAVAVACVLIHCGCLGSVFYIGFFQHATLPFSWELPVGLVLVSATLWENFLHFDFSLCCSVQVHVQKLRHGLTKTRLQANIFILIGKATMFIVCVILFVDNFQISSFRLSTADLQAESGVISNVSVNFKEILNLTITTEPPVNTTNSTKSVTVSKVTVPSQTIASNSNSFWADVIHFFTDNILVVGVLAGTLICVYCASLACKLHMQVAGFALPLVLTSPVSMFVTYLDCSGIMSAFYLTPFAIQCPNTNIDELKYVLVIAGVFYLSLLMLTFYIWIPQCERMAKLETMFIEPLRDAIFPETYLLFRRRDDTLEHETAWKRTEDTSATNGQVPFVYVCATMWHETLTEMQQLLKSLFRLDHHCASSRQAQKKFKTTDPDMFNTEIHIIFDDAFEVHSETKQRVLNSYVQQLLDCVPSAAKSVAKGDIPWEKDPKKTRTPYGGRLTWTMPGGTKMMVHLKDKTKIRHRKRWSQIMYLYYLLGFKLFGADKAKDHMIPTEKTGKHHLVRPYASLLNKLKKQDFKRANNTFIFTLDGDVDFQPGAVLLLIDRMKKNRKVGAVCGRIHPIGSGPMVWYQQFEYAVGHWLQKAAENVFGCVLCCPGCFSLFRASALMDDNVMKTYTTKPTEARHYIQFEQGEDRWLCTLLLQQGYKIDYCAAADALTFAPETFFDFFVQRRRWSPSTLANIIDLLSSWKSTTKMNDNISMLFILYQLIVMISSLLAPATVTMMIAGSYTSVLQIDDGFAYILAIAPVAIYIFICIKCKPNLQLNAAAAFTSLYCIIMVIVTVGTILNLTSEEVVSPNVMFLIGLAAIFTVAGLWHPNEASCLVHGLLYFMTVPSTFVFLTVYYLCNIHNVSWGTREGPKKEPTQDQQQEVKPKKNFCSKMMEGLNLSKILEDVGVFIRQMLGKKEEEKSTPEKQIESSSTQRQPTIIAQLNEGNGNVPRETSIELVEQFEENGRFWMEMEYLRKGSIEPCSLTEDMFWKFMLENYLYPLSEDVDHKKKISDELLYLRKNVVFGFFLLNFMFSVALLQLQLKREELINFYIVGKYEPISVAFLVVFAVVLLLQFFAMLVHRWSTFQHLIASTRVWTCQNAQGSDVAFQEALKEAKKLNSMEPDADYGTDEDSDSHTESSEALEPDYSDNEDIAPDYSEGEDNGDVTKPRPPSTAYDRMFKENYKHTVRHYKKSRNRQNYQQSNKKNNGRWGVYDRTLGRNRGHGVQRRNTGLNVV